MSSQPPGFARPTASSERRGQQGGQTGKEKKAAPTVTVSETEASTHATSKQDKKSSPTVKPSNVIDFRKYALLPREIYIHETAFLLGLGSSASEHFAAEAAANTNIATTNPADYSDRYDSTAVFLEVAGEVSRIAQQFALAHKYNRNEQTYVHLAVTHLLKTDDLVESNGPEKTLTLCLTQWGPPLPVDRSLGPPIVRPETPARSFDYNIFPDMTFFIASNVFEDLARQLMRSHGYEVTDGGVCPYLTCEFKKKLLDEQAAQNQVAAASTMWLHERVELRKAAETPSSPCFTDLRHYAIIISAYRFSVWVTVPNIVQSTPGGRGLNNTHGKQAVQGYSVRRLWQDNLETESGVLRFAIWINEIHRWGLGPCLDAFKADVLRILTRRDIHIPASQPLPIRATVDSQPTTSSSGINAVSRRARLSSLGIPATQNDATAPTSSPLLEGEGTLMLSGIRISPRTSIQGRKQPRRSSVPAVLEETELGNKTEEFLRDNMLGGLEGKEARCGG